MEMIINITIYAFLTSNYSQSSLVLITLTPMNSKLYKLSDKHQYLRDIQLIRIIPFSNLYPSIKP